MKKQFFTAALLAMAAWLNAGSAFAWDEPTQDSDDFYMITTPSEMQWIGDQVANGNTTIKFKLMNDLDFTGVQHTPIGRDTAKKFDGEFDGQHHVIKNMLVNTPDKDGVGVFGFVRGNAIIKNLVIDRSCSFTGKAKVGALIGGVQTRADKKLTITNIVNFADICAKAPSNGAGAIIGECMDQWPFFKMHNCANLGNVTSETEGKYATGLVGYNENGQANSQVWCCYNAGTLTPNDGVNNIFRGSYRSVLNTYDVVYTTSKYQSLTNVVKPYSTNDPLHSGELCYLLNNGISLQGRSDTSLGEEWTQDLSDPNSVPMPNANGKKIYQVADLDCAGNPKGGVAYSNTEGGSKDDHTFVNGVCSVCKAAVQEDWMAASEDGYYHLRTPEQVEWFSHMVRDARHGAMNVKLDADIDYAGVKDAHLPIGSSGQKYFGHFDGQGHRILNMILTAESSSQLVNRGYDGNGFFGSVRGGGTDANGTVTNEVIIENLIIDATCDIKHDQNFAAGVVAHINSRNDNNSLIIIRNCGNEANVESTGKNIAGILGCVEGTEVGLKIINCWNKGNIIGEGGESAAICGWTGTPKDYLTKEVKGCWNIGEVTGVDANGYNMIRAGKLNDVLYPALNNVVDLCIANKGNQGKVAVWNSADPIASGELCYLLNGDQTKIVYTQNIGKDAMPVYGTTSAQVYQAGTVNCLGASVGTIDYNNVSGETVQLGHQISDEIGMCSVCHTQFQQPAQVDGYYQLKNAGHVEWFAGKINGGDLTACAKLANDIDMLGIENLHTPIGWTEGQKFNGTFDGQGHRITNLIYSNTDKECVGFFGWLRGKISDDGVSTTIKNLIIDKTCSFTGKNKVGALVGTVQVPAGASAEQTAIIVENVVNEANVESKGADAGGIFGGENGGNAKYTIRNVVNTGNITSTGSAGALCCYLHVSDGSLIENFLNLGTISKINEGKFNIGRHNIANATNLIDLSDTEGKTQGIVAELNADDVENGKVAYIMGFKQLIGTDEYPSPLNEVEVKYVGEAGYATMVAAEDTEIKGNAKAYTARITNSYVTLDEVDDVPAGAAVILKGSYYNALSTTAASDFTSNQLIPVTEEIDADGTQYVLAKVDDKVGFYKAENGTIAAGKAYLTVAGSTVKAFYFEDETATGIVNANANTNANQEIYNLAGQRIQKMQQGINIVGGKKILK